MNPSKSLAVLLHFFLSASTNLRDCLLADFGTADGIDNRTCFGEDGLALILREDFPGGSWTFLDLLASGCHPFFRFERGLMMG